MINSFLNLFDLKLVKTNKKLSLKDIDFDKEDPTPLLLPPPPKAALRRPPVPPDPSLKKTVVPSEKKRKTKITIHLAQGVQLSYVSDNKLDDISFPWSDFYTWFFTKETPLFTFKYTTGETIFRRVDIVRVDYVKLPN